MEFTSDWFSYALPNFKGVVSYLTDKEKSGKETIDNVLEIGSHEGRATCWMVQNMLSDTGTITCIDPFANAPLNPFKGDLIPEDRTYENRFNENVKEAMKPGQTLIVHRNLSYYALAELVTQKKEYDFIYVDGGHDSDIVLADAVLAFSLLRNGGLMLFDDYQWANVSDHLARPKMSIDAFVNMFIKRLHVGFTNYQLGVIKKEQPAHI